MRRWIQACVVVVALLGLGRSAAAEAPRPNIIYIMADDLGYGELGSYGQKLIETPNLDRLAREGLRFTRFYAGSTVCAPSRSVLMTGKHTGHTTVRGNGGRNRTDDPQMLREGDFTVAEMLQRAGYKTGLVGKWGLGLEGSEGHPNRQGFDYFFGFLNQSHAHNHYPSFLWRNQEKVDLPNDLVPMGEVGQGYSKNRKVYASDLFAREAEEFIERNQDQPFFLFFSLVLPHANNERTRALGNGAEVPDLGPYQGKDWSEQLKGHAAMITRMDSQVGHLMALLGKLGIDQKTLVMFTSDNGPHKESGQDPTFFDPNGPLRGYKRDLFEGGVRVPFIARWPGKIAPGTSDHVGYFGDLFATAAELAGEPAPEGLDSISFVPTLLGRTSAQKKHPYLYWEFHEGGFTQGILLGERWKGIRVKRLDAPIQVYDLANDPGEEHDIAAREPERVAEFRRLFTEARTDSPIWPIKEAPLRP